MSVRVAVAIDLGTRFVLIMREVEARVFIEKPGRHKLKATFNDGLHRKIFHPRLVMKAEGLRAGKRPNAIIGEKATR